MKCTNSWNRSTTVCCLGLRRRLTTSPPCRQRVTSDLADDERLDDHHLVRGEEVANLVADCAERTVLNLDQPSIRADCIDSVLSQPRFTALGPEPIAELQGLVKGCFHRTESACSGAAFCRLLGLQHYAGLA